MEFQVPVIDISAYVSGGTADRRRETARRIDDAARTVGFMQITGHAVPRPVIDDFAAALDSFFALPLEAKAAYRTAPSINRGYSPPKSESLSLSLGVESATRMNDFFEAFNVGVATTDCPGLDLPAEDYAENLWPTELPQFSTAIGTYFSRAARVARTLTTIFADALELPPGFFDRFTDHSLDVLRMNNYALPPGTVDLDGDLTGMSEHTDYGIVTVLWADQAPGLQVLDADGTWHDVQPADNALLVNLGDLMARWTNEQWLSTLHRVKPPIINGTIQRRRSAAYFHDGNIDALIQTLPSCLGAGSKYAPVTVADHIRAKLAGSRGLQSNTNAEREAARVLAATDRY
ncbi:isopenicillin N synthase family dioxygenase [Nocardia seriolae]|uniref:2OG-Fe(II) oxygenase n=1 Tax=Nocardia seriolae TaxID=37332 RepID=A0ABC8AN13_9NOCA|nr:2-oxoglutarate and iron-dependent oxygenase domain-containing protein [Nocardia seriolae]GEM21867.1 2OG-Fe(II) oxygenase [Nocardia seriolae NBRC 15557]APA95510.1 Leucocyanidin oxygenase [Nocardia seriolae]OJF78170.1 2OG-Fe(II) oxygenase [Nocardia seriolae]PSK27919.1 isopenicillin N synthase family oxygenase [Nocardia seriolae]QOW31617.1 isopenicillin N synthase family oxygenase [Nocardia seriolae]